MKFTATTKEKSEGFEKVHIEEGLYNAILIEVKPIPEGQFGERVAWVYELPEKKVKLAYICYSFSKATRDNKLGKAFIAHGVNIVDGELDADKLIGSVVKAWVEDYDYEVEVNGKKVKKQASTISKLKPLVEPDQKLT